MAEVAPTGVPEGSGKLVVVSSSETPLVGVCAADAEPIPATIAAAFKQQSSTAELVRLMVITPLTGSPRPTDDTYGHAVGLRSRVSLPDEPDHPKVHDRATSPRTER